MVIPRKKHMFQLNTEYSEAACEVTLNPFTGTAKVWYWSGGPYTYKRVSRRAIAKAIVTDVVTGGLSSVGGWIHTNLHKR
jgi:hypothetical protein